MAEVKRNVLEIPKRVIDVVWLLLYSLTLFALNDLFLVPGFNDGNLLPSKDILHQAKQVWDGNRSKEKIRPNYVSETMKYGRPKNEKKYFPASAQN